MKILTKVSKRAVKNCKNRGVVGVYFMEKIPYKIKTILFNEYKWLKLGNLMYIIDKIGMLYHIPYNDKK